jgi:hypothetical protein
MQVVPDSGWLSVGGFDRTVSSDSVMLSRLSGGLRKLYQDLLNEPLPEHLAVFVRELEGQGRFASEGLACGSPLGPIPGQEQAVRPQSVPARGQ